MKRRMAIVIAIILIACNVVQACAEDLCLAERQRIRSELEAIGYTKVGYICADRFRVSPAEDPDHKYMMVNSRGEILTKEVYCEFLPVCEGRIWVRGDDGYGYIDLDGNVVSDPTGYNYQGSFHEGRARVVKGEKRGYIDLNGEIISDLQWDDARDFRDGYAVVGVNDYSQPSYYDFFSDREAWPKKYGVIDRNGEIIVAPQWDEIGYHYNGFDGIFQVALYDTGEGTGGRQAMYGFVSSDGRTISECVWEDATDFSDGVAFVCRDGRWYRMDIRGEVAPIPEETAGQIDSFFLGGSEGKWEVYKDVKTLGEALWGYADHEGKIVISPRFLATFEFQNGYACVQVDSEKWGAIDAQGNTVIPFEWDSIQNLGEGIFLIKKNGRCGLVTAPIEQPVKLEYEYIAPIFNHTEGYGIAVREVEPITLHMLDGDDIKLREIGIEGDENYCYIDGNGEVLLEKVDMLSDVDRALFNHHTPAFYLNKVNYLI